MRTASQVLEAKGYDPAQINDIVYANNNALDIQVREVFNINEPIHLWECYNVGDADIEVLNNIAIQKGYKSYKALLREMNWCLIELAEDYPAL